MSMNPCGWVFPHQLYRCAQPSTAADVAALKKLGVTTIIKLNTGGWDGLSNQDESKLFKGFQVNTDYEIPPSFNMPNLPQVLRKCCAAINKLLGQKEVVCVHCTHGKDRTGAVVAAFEKLYRYWTQAQWYPAWVDYGGAPMDAIELSQDKPLFSAVEAI